MPLKLPDWMREQEAYEPVGGGNRFILQTLKSLGGVMARIRFQEGHEKKHSLPALVKLLLLLALLILLSVSRQSFVLLALTAAVLLYLATWPGKDIVSILKAPVFAGILALLLFLPAMILKPSGIGNQILVTGKIVLSVLMVNLYHHTTQWNHVTQALRRLHLPGILIFTFDMTLKYIVLLGRLMEQLLTALRLRSVGRSERKYDSVGGVMGVTFLISTELSREMADAMRCRGFTDDYQGL